MISFPLKYPAIFLKVKHSLVNSLNAYRGAIVSKEMWNTNSFVLNSVHFHRYFSVSVGAKNNLINNWAPTKGRYLASLSNKALLGYYDKHWSQIIMNFCHSKLTVNHRATRLLVSTELKSPLNEMNFGTWAEIK